jgi:hypothetical protein
MRGRQFSAEPAQASQHPSVPSVAGDRRASWGFRGWRCAVSHISRIHAPDLAFAHDYRRHVLPQLTRHMPVSAVLVALNRAGFAEEYDTIVRDAWNMGRWFLPNPLWHDLEDWIADELVDAITNIEAEIGEDLEDAELTYFPPDRDVFAEYAALCQEMADAAG